MEKSNSIWRSTYHKAFGMTSRNQKAWVPINITQSWPLHENTVHSWWSFHFSFAFPQCPAERDFGECSVPHCRTVEQGLNVWRRRYWEVLASYKNLATVTSQSNSRGKQQVIRQGRRNWEATTNTGSLNQGHWGLGGLSWGSILPLTGWETLPIFQIL